MNSHIKKWLFLTAILGIVTIASGTAKADIVVVTGVNNQGTDNVLLSPATDVLTVTGHVGQTNLVVNFTSSSGSGLLVANPSGQATVSGGTGNTDLTQLTFGLANNDTFTRAVFNINAGTDGAVLIHVEGVNISGGFFEDEFVVDANGQNFFTVTAINGQLITSISLTAIDGAVFQDVRQVRLGGSDIVQSVPEPASMFLLGTGLVGAAGMFRRRFRKSSSIAE
jgi:PEP-CTERM motif-containing protein